jgi:hypothetical protein
MDDVPVRSAAVVVLKKWLADGIWSQRLKTPPAVIFGCKLLALSDPKKSSATSRNDFCEEKDFEVAIFRRKKNRI